MEPLRPNSLRAKAALIFLYLIFGLLGAIAITQMVVFILYPTDIFSLISLGVPFLILTYAYKGLNILYFLFLIVSAVLFILWFRRAYFNLGLRTQLTDSDRWAAGAWFVPILNLFRPYQMMREMYLCTGRIFTKHLGSVPAGFTMKHLGWWWGFWISGNIASLISTRIAKNATDIMVMKYSVLGEFFITVVVLVACFFAVRVIKRYAAIERLLADLSVEVPAPVSVAPAPETPVSNHPPGQDPFD